MKVKARFSPRAVRNNPPELVSALAVPAGSVVVPGSLPSNDGKYSLYCAVIVKQVDAQTRAKTAINELLRSD